MAGLRSPSYTGALPARQLRPTQSRPALLAAASLAACLALGGCGIVMPLSALMSGSGSAAADTPANGPETTGSIGPGAPAPAETDADAVRRAIEVSAARGVDAPVPWKNGATGNSGTVTTSSATRASNGAPCRDFETTLVSVSGVDLHAGRICQGFTGAWEVLRFERVGG